MKKLHCSYTMQAVGLQRIYASVARTFNADQPLTDLFSLVLDFVNQPVRSVALRTPRVILLGFSGSGRKTQAKLLSNKYGLVSVDCGRLLLQELAKRSKLASSIKIYILQDIPGNLLSAVMSRQCFCSQYKDNSLGEYLLDYVAFSFSAPFLVHIYNQLDLN